MSSRKENLKKYFKIDINGRSLRERITDLDSIEELLSDDTVNESYKTKLVKRRINIRKLLSNRGIHYHPSTRHIEFSNNVFCKSGEWKRIKYFALLLYGNYCAACGSTTEEKRLSVDHILSKHEFPHLALEMSNLQVLCTDCNSIKDETDLTDWRSETQKNRALDWVNILSKELRFKREQLKYSI